jgi:hypothetical protein
MCREPLPGERLGCRVTLATADRLESDQIAADVALLPEYLVIPADQREFLGVGDRIQIEGFDVDVRRIGSGILRIVPI